MFGRAKKPKAPSAEIQPLDRMNRSELHYAALEGTVEDVRRLIDLQLEVNAPDLAGMTPLHFAAQSQQAEVVRELLGAGANVELEDRDGNTALYTATYNSRGTGETIGVLREHGADPFHANRNGSTPVALARRIANFPIAQYFSDLP